MFITRATASDEPVLNNYSVLSFCDNTIWLNL